MDTDCIAHGMKYIRVKTAKRDVIVFPGLKHNGTIFQFHVAY